MLREDQYGTVDPVEWKSKADQTFDQPRSVAGNPSYSNVYCFNSLLSASTLALTKQARPRVRMEIPADNVTGPKFESPGSLHFCPSSNAANNGGPDRSSQSQFLTGTQPDALRREAPVDSQTGFDTLLQCKFDAARCT